MGVDGAQPLKRIRRTEPEIRHPPGQIAADIFHAGRDGPPPIRGRHLPHGSLQPLFRFSGGKDGDVATLFRAAETKAQKPNVLRLAHATLLLVDLEPHALLQESPDRCHDALPGALAPHEDITIVGVANEPQAPPRQFAVQFIENDVGQQGRKRTALGRSFLDG